MTRKTLPLLCGILLSCFTAIAQSVSSFDRIILPMGYVEGKLDNGLNYVLVRNGSPDRMIELRLIFRAGSVLETSENRGAAHFLEHMAFGGTKHFPKHKLVDYLESLGIQYGIGINAYTGYDRTIYQIAVPSDNPKNFENALLILKDWLAGITLEPEKVKGEKGIIIEELRGYDVGDDFYNLKIGSGLYSKGIPLGTEADIRSMTPEKLRAFHSKWYTLSQATVVVVGDIETSDARRRLEKMFGRLKPTSSPEYREYPHTYDAGVNYAEVADTLMIKSELDLMVPHECTSRRIVADAVEGERNSMLVSALSRRMRETGTDVDLANTWYLADKEHFAISISGASKQDITSKMEKAVTELYRVARYGFTPEEMASVREKGLSHLDIPDYSASSSYICDAVANDVMFGDRDITDPKQFEWVKEQVASTLSEDLQKILVRWLFAAENTILAAYRYNPLTTTSFTEDELKSAWQNAKKVDLGKFFSTIPEDDQEQPVAELPGFLKEDKTFNPSSIVSRRAYPRTGVTEVLLQNGFRIIARHTDDEEGRIQAQLLAPGGLSMIPENNYPLYSGTAGYIELGGIEGVDDNDYTSILADNGLGLILALEQWWHGMIASAPANRSGILFNLMLEKMLRTRLNYEEFESIRKDELEDLGEESYISRLMKTDYSRQISAQIDSLMGNMVYGRRLETTKEDIAAIDLDQIAKFYKSLYSNPDGMTCILCGDFDTESVIRQAVSVFGSIPPVRDADGNVVRSSVGQSHFELPQGGISKNWENANPSQSLFDYILYGQYEPSLRNSLILKMMQNIVRNRLLSVLREGESLVYSPYISLFYNAVPDRVFYFDINASVDSNNSARVYEILREIISDLQKRKVSSRELKSIKQIFLVNKRNWLQDDATSNWKTHIVNLMKNNESLEDFENYESVLDSITASDIRDAFRTLIDSDRYVLMSLGDFEYDKKP